MVVLAVLLLLVVAAVVLFVAVTGSTLTVDLAWGAADVVWSPTALAVFLLGAAVMLLAEASVGLLLRSSRRTGQRRQELKRLRRLEARQAGTGPVPATAPPSPAPTSLVLPPDATGQQPATPEPEPSVDLTSTGSLEATSPGGRSRRSGRRAAR